MKRHPITFDSFSVSGQEITANKLDHKSNRLVASDECCWGFIGVSTILILNLINTCHA